MADDTDSKNDAGEEYDYNENENAETNPPPELDSNDAADSTPVVPSQQIPSDFDGNNADANADVPPADIADAAGQDNYEGDYDDEPLPDVTVNLYVNEIPDSVVADTLNTVTDEYGNPVSQWSKAIEDYTSTIAQDLLDGNGTATGKQGWLGSWSWNKSLLVGLIALCIIGIILALICFVIGKKSKRNNSAPTSASVTTKNIVTKGVNPETKYTPVPTDV